jgi:hypothetical protein
MWKEHVLNENGRKSLENQGTFIMVLLSADMATIIKKF